MGSLDEIYHDLLNYTTFQRLHPTFQIDSFTLFLNPGLVSRHKNTSFKYRIV